MLNGTLWIELFAYFCWWAPRESNSAPMDYESTALTKHELEAREGAILPRQARLRHVTHAV